jgi:hypothetical protein
VIGPVALQWILIGAGVLTGAVFMLAFRFALREGQGLGDDLEPLPPVRLVAGGGIRRSSIVAGRGRARLMRGLRVVQAGAVAVGITAVFFMFLCLAAMVAVALAG